MPDLDATMEVGLTIPDPSNAGRSKSVHLNLPMRGIGVLLEKRQEHLRDEIAKGGSLNDIEDAADELTHTLDALGYLMGARDWQLRGVPYQNVAEATPQGTPCVTCGHTFMAHRSPDEGGCKAAGCDCTLFVGENIPTVEEREEALLRELEEKEAHHEIEDEDESELRRTPIRGYVGQFAAEIEMALNQAEEDWEDSRMGRLVDVIEDQAAQMEIGSSRLEEVREQAVQIAMVAAVLFNKADEELMRHES